MTFILYPFDLYTVCVLFTAESYSASMGRAGEWHRCRHRGCWSWKDIVPWPIPSWCFVFFPFPFSFSPTFQWIWLNFFHQQIWHIFFSWALPKNFRCSFCPSLHGSPRSRDPKWSRQPDSHMGWCLSWWIERVYMIFDSRVRFMDMLMTHSRYHI